MVGIPVIAARNLRLTLLSPIMTTETSSSIIITFDGPVERSQVYRLAELCELNAGLLDPDSTVTVSIRRTGDSASDETAVGFGQPDRR